VEPQQVVLGQTEAADRRIAAATKRGPPERAGGEVFRLTFRSRRRGRICRKTAISFAA
jgi:hypothetical protein